MFKLINKNNIIIITKKNQVCINHIFTFDKAAKQTFANSQKWCKLTTIFPNKQAIPVFFLQILSQSKLYSGMQI
jgi:hypothetical protein